MGPLHHLRRFGSDFGPLSAHRDADGAGLERERIIDSIADHERTISGLDLIQGTFHFLAREGLGAEFRQTQ
jgi:hypothetical protein